MGGWYSLAMTPISSSPHLCVIMLAQLFTFWHPVEQKLNVNNLLQPFSDITRNTYLHRSCLMRTPNRVVVSIIDLPSVNLIVELELR